MLSGCGSTPRVVERPVGPSAALYEAVAEPQLPDGPVKNSDLTVYVRALQDALRKANSKLTAIGVWANSL